MSEDFDSFLASPLDDLGDDGFSARVMGAVLDAKLRRSRIETALAGFAVATGILCLALTDAGQAAARLVPALAMTPGAEACVASILLSLMAARFAAA